MSIVTVRGLYTYRTTLQWRHEHDGVSNHQPHHCLLNRLFRCRSKKTSQLHVTGLCVGNLPVTGEFPAQMASNADNVFIWRRHHDTMVNHSVYKCDGIYWCKATSRHSNDNNLAILLSFFCYQSSCKGACWSGPLFVCLLLRVISDYAQPITGQVTQVTCPVIGRAQAELTLRKRQKTDPDDVLQNESVKILTINIP